MSTPARRAQKARWAGANPEKRRAASVRHYARARAELNAYKLMQGCMDCGYREHVVALQFDHRPGEVKSFNLGNGKCLHLARRVVWAEVAKCDVVCANCHMIRTATRRGLTGAAASILAQTDPDWAKLRHRRPQSSRDTEL